MSLRKKLDKLINDYKNQLDEKTNERVGEMKNDLNGHYLIYEVLTIDED